MWHPRKETHGIDAQSNVKPLGLLTEKLAIGLFEAMISAMMKTNRRQFTGSANVSVAVDTDFSTRVRRAKEYWLGYYYFIDL